jgi:hypothetical protein
MSEIIKQVDSSDVAGVADDLVAFVEAEDVERGPAEQPWTEHRYSAAIYRRPIRLDNTALHRCGHEHRQIGPATACARRLLRVATQEGATR